MAVYISPSEGKNSSPSSSTAMEYIVDHEADIATLPVTPYIKVTSTALVIDTGNLYILTNSGWRVL